MRFLSRGATTDGRLGDGITARLCVRLAEGVPDVLALRTERALCLNPLVGNEGPR